MQQRLQVGDAGQTGAAVVVFQRQEAGCLCLVVVAVAGVVQHVRPEAAQRLADGGQRGVVQVIDLDEAAAHRLVERPLDGADLLLGVQWPLVIGRRDHHQDAQRRGRGRGVEPTQAVRRPAQQQAAGQRQELFLVVQIFPRQPPQRRGVAVQRQRQPGLAPVGVVELQERGELRAVAEQQAIKPPAVLGQLLLLILRPRGVGRPALDRLAGVARHSLLQHPLRLEIHQQVGPEVEEVATHLRAVAPAGHGQELVVLRVGADLLDGDDEFGWERHGASRDQGPAIRDVSEHDFLS